MTTDGLSSMNAPALPPHREISWNGINISVPVTWEVKVTAKCHLNFEKNFEAVMEMRWQRARPKNLEKHVAAFVKQYQKMTDSPLDPVPVPQNHHTLLEEFEACGYSPKNAALPTLVFLFNYRHELLIVIHAHTRAHGPHPLDHIQKLSCSATIDGGADITSEDTSFWAIQDFQARIPSIFVLDEYTMKAGLTVLRFQGDKTRLELCRLAPATHLLGQQSLDDIFLRLAGEQRLQVHALSETTRLFSQSPGIMRQILLRLQRRKPFRLATFWHDQYRDRLAGVFMESTRPIDPATHQRICSHYEFLPN